MFTEAEIAIFYVVSMLGSDVDWNMFPDPSKSYPYDERNGDPAIELTPLFRVERIHSNGNTILGEVTKMGPADTWVVGNGIALSSREDFFKATGRDLVKVSGVGQTLRATVSEVRHAHHS